MKHRITSWFGPGLLVAFASLSQPALAAPVSAELLAAAEKEGKVTWCNGSIPDAANQEMIKRFKELYPKIDLVMLRSTSQVAYQRLHQDFQNKMRNCDIFSSSDISHFVELDNAGRIEEYVPANAAEIHPEYKMLYKEGFYYPGMIALQIMSYNSDLVDKASAPTNWTDLLDPEWKGKAAMGHPGFSGFTGTWLILMRELYGDEFLDKLKENAPLIGRSNTDSVSQVVAGERLIGVSASASIYQSQLRGNPIEMVYPEDGSLLMVAPVAIVKDPANPSAARVFMEFLLGEDYSEVAMNVAGYYPVNKNVKMDDRQRAIGTFKTVRPPLDTIVNEMRESIELWRDTFGN